MIGSTMHTTYFSDLIIDHFLNADKVMYIDVHNLFRQTLKANGVTIKKST